jgi:LysM repeat protein
MSVPDRKQHRWLRIGVYAVLALGLSFLSIRSFETAKSFMLAPSSPLIVRAAPSMVQTALVRDEQPEPTSAATAPANTTLSTIPQSNPSLVREPSLSAAPECIHTVKSGDTLFDIARARGTTVKAIKHANGLENERLTVGTKLKIPVQKMLTAATGPD